MKAQPILSLMLATAARSSVGVLATNEPKTHRPGFMKLTAEGLFDSAMLSRVQTHDKTFDVSPASALHNFVVASTPSASQGIHRRLHAFYHRFSELCCLLGISTQSHQTFFDAVAGTHQEEPFSSRPLSEAMERICSNRPATQYVLRSARCEYLRRGHP